MNNFKVGDLVLHRKMLFELLRPVGHGAIAFLITERGIQGEFYIPLDKCKPAPTVKLREAKLMGRYPSVLIGGLYVPESIPMQVLISRYRLSRVRFREWRNLRIPALGGLTTKQVLHKPNGQEEFFKLLDQIDGNLVLKRNGPHPSLAQVLELVMPLKAI